MPPNTVCADRSTRWGNPFIAGEPSGVFAKGQGLRGAAEVLVPELTLEKSLEFYRDLVEGFLSPEMYPHGHAWRARFMRFNGSITVGDAARFHLRGKNLACWCKLCPKHQKGKPFDVACADCAPCHVDILGSIVNRR